jgi:hypothetical protein
VKPKILSVKHDAVSVTMADQPLTLIATVQPGNAPILTVDLYYTQSAHAAPLKTEMKPAGMGVYQATIPSEFLKKNKVISYYMEATDTAGESVETKYRTVTIKPASEMTYKSKPAYAGGTREEKQNWKPAALIAVGGAVVVGWAIAENSGGSSGSEKAVDPQGEYSGSVTFCRVIDADPITCSTIQTTITIDSTGLVTSPDLADGTSVVGELLGDAFDITVPASQVDLGFTGDIILSGTARNDVISGQISGTASDMITTITYSGTFSAER